MYRIRRASGQEQVYRSIQELTAGVQRGEVTAEAEIYHQRTERWLSIESHPHYRMAADGSTATRTSRLKFTRPSSPVSTSGVRPTPPAAQRPDQSDLEELNRLLVLLDPLPSPAQRAEPALPAVQSPPDLTLIRPEAMPRSMSSDDPQPTFGTMLRLEDLDPARTAAPVPPDASPIEVIRDERILSEEPEAPAEPSAFEPVAAFADMVPSDLGLPMEIHLDAIPVAVELEPVALAAAVPTEAQATIAPDIAEIVAAIPPVFLEPVSISVMDDAEPKGSDSLPAAGRVRRRARPMLYVAGAAMVALAVFAFTGGGKDGNQSMVTPASATAPAIMAPAVDSASALAGQAVGFPRPTTEPIARPTKGGPPNEAGRDSATPAALLPSAPTIDLATAGTALVETESEGPRAGAGSGSALARSYARSYAAMASDFSAQMDRSGLVRLFSQTQLTTNDGLSGARRALEAATTAVRQYHAREATIERAYQDSARKMERNGATAADLRDWMTHPSLKESQEAAGEGARLVGQLDAVFALLQSQSGRYRIEGSMIRFDDADAAARYADLQGWITRRLEHWSGQPASSVPTTVQPLLDGIGLTRLPTSK